MITLSEDDFLARGMHRDCYVHPEDDRLCIKISLRGDVRETEREIAYYGHLDRRKVSWEMLPRYHGTVETNRGPGAVFDLIRDADGAVSTTLEQYLVDPDPPAEMAEDLARAFRALKAYLLGNRIITRTIKAKNLVYKRAAAGRGRLVVIDNIGNTEFVPYCNYVAVFARKKISRKWRQFEADLLKHYPGNDLVRRMVGGQSADLIWCPMPENAAMTDAGAPDNKVLDLSEAEWLGRGWKRDCFLHPGDPNLCVKVASDERLPHMALRERVISVLRGRSIGSLNNEQEWAAFQQYGEKLSGFVPTYRGLIDTSLGKGLVVEMVRDASGAPSKNLKDWLETASDDRGANLARQFRAFFDILLRENIWLMDLNHQNFLIQELENGTVRPWLIDLKRLTDNKEMFQVSSWSKTLKRRKLRRRISRFNDKFDLRLRRKN